MDLVVAAKTARTVVKFVEGGPLGDALTELNMTAAATALRKAGDAEDKRAQVWSAVNHLESAEAAIEKQLQRKRLAALNPQRFGKVMSKYQFIKGLMAICYRYLDEEALAEQALANAKNPPKFVHEFYSEVAYGLVLVPVLNIPAILEKPGDEFRVDWDSFELPPRELPPRDPRLT